MVEPQPSKLMTWVRFPLPAPKINVTRMKVVTFFMFMRKVMELNVENAKEVLREYLGESNPKKYAHSLRVADVAGKLAKK